MKYNVYKKSLIGGGHISSQDDTCVLYKFFFFLLVIRDTPTVSNNTRPHLLPPPGYTKPGHPQNTTPGVNSGPLLIHHGSTPSTPVPQAPAAQPPPATPVTPVFPGMVPSHNPNAPSPSPAPSPSVIKAGPQTPTGHATPTPSSVIKAHTPSGTPCGTPAPGGGGFSSSPFHVVSQPGTPTSRSGPDTLPHQKAFLQSMDSQAGSGFHGNSSQAGNLSGSVIRSYTPSGPSSLTPGSSTPVIPSCSTPGPSPKPSPAHSAQIQAAMGPPGVLQMEQQRAALSRHAGSSSGSNSPVPSAFKGTSRSATPSVSSLVVPGSAQAALARSLGLSHPSASPQVSLPSPVAITGLHALSSSPVPSHYPGLSPFQSLSSVAPSTIPSSMSVIPPSTNMSNHPPTSIYPGLAHNAAPGAASPFGLGLTSAPSIFPGLPPGPSPAAFPGLGVSGGHGAGSPVLSSFMGLPGATPSSVSSVAPLQAAVVAAAAAAGVPSSSPVLPGFASAFSSNFQPGYVTPSLSVVHGRGHAKADGSCQCSRMFPALPLVCHQSCYWSFHLWKHLQSAVALCSRSR